MEKLPVHEITSIPDEDELESNGEDLGIEQIAFTKDPAVLVKGMAFTSHRKKLFFVDEKKMRIAAPMLIPMEIYRNDKELGEHYVEFTEQEVERLFVKLMSQIKSKDLFNLEHNPKKIVPAYLLEVWMVDNPKKDRSYSTFGVEVPKGTIFAVAQVTDKEYFEKLEKEEITGFSIEGYLGLKLKSKIAMKKQKFSNKKRYSAKRKFAEDAEVIDGELTVVTEDVAVNADVVVITEDLTVVEDFTGDVTIEGQDVHIEGGVITEVAEVVEEEVVMSEEEKKKEEEEKEALSDEGKEEEKKEEMKAEDEKKDEEEKDKFEVDEASVMAIVQPKLDEIYELIADLKAAGEDKREEMNEEEKKDEEEDRDKQLLHRVNVLREKFNSN